MGLFYFITSATMAKITIVRSSISVMLERGTLSIVPKQAQESFCFFSKLLITPTLEKPISRMVNTSVLIGSQFVKYKMPKLDYFELFLNQSLLPTCPFITRTQL